MVKKDFEKIQFARVPDIYDFINSIQDITGWVSLTEAFDYVFKPLKKSREEMVVEFEKFWRGTHAQILKKVSAKPRSFGIDIGSGNGQLLESAKQKKIEMVGLTLSPRQAKYCKANGMKAHVLPYTDPAFVKMYKGKADFVTLIGSIEHFTNPYEIIEKRKAHSDDPDFEINFRKNVYKEMYAIISKILKPGGKVYLSCCSFNSVYPTPQEVVMNPVTALFKKGWDLFHTALLERALHGYYPEKGMLAECAKASGFKVLDFEDGTADYYQTSLYWWYLIHQALKNHPLKTIGRFVQFFFKSPSHAVIAFVNVFTESWIWQFKPRKQGTPVSLERLVLQKK